MSLARSRTAVRILSLVLWLLAATALLHHSRYPNVFGRYSSSWVAVILLVVCAALAVTAIASGNHLEHLRAEARFWIPMALLSVVLSCAVVEAAMRMFDLLGSSFYTEIRRYSQVMVADPVLYFKNPANFRGVFQRVEISTNSLGLRDRPLEPKSPAKPRILVLGDSVAFGWGVPVEDTFSRQLERQARDRYSMEIETVNSGVPGYNTVQELAFLKTYATVLAPDAVILLYVDNDTDYLQPKHAYIAGMPNPFRYPGEAADYLLSGSRVLFMARHFAPVIAVAMTGGGRGDERSTPGWRLSMQSVEKIAAYCRSRGLPFATYLFRLTPDPHTDRLKESLSEIAARDHFLLADTLPWFAGTNFRLLVNSFVDTHPNAAGHRILAKGIAESLADSGIALRPPAISAVRR